MWKIGLPINTQSMIYNLMCFSADWIESKYVYSEVPSSAILLTAMAMVEHVWNVMAHAQKPDLVFQWNAWLHLNRQGHQFSRLLAAEVCASAVVMVVMLYTPFSEVECKTTGYPFYSHAPSSLPLPCVTVCHQVSTELYKTVYLGQDSHWLWVRRQLDDFR